MSADPQPAQPGTSPLSVAAALRLFPLDRGRVVAGSAGLEERLVRWVAVIEWPVEDFVAPGEFVLTTGVGCDEGRFEQLTRELADLGAAALCVGVGPGAPLEQVPDGSVKLGEKMGFPVIEMPWKVRFADILRALVDRLLAARYAALGQGGELFPPGLAAALLRRDALVLIAQATEQMIDLPVLVLDGEFVPVAAGPLADARLGEPAAIAERGLALDSDAAARLRSRLGSDEVVAVADLEPLGLPAALVAPAAAEGRVLGYVLALVGGRQESALTPERRALDHARIAVAIELLRRQAAAEAEARVHGDFLWELASGELDRQELAAKATLLGYPLRQPYRVLLARAEEPGGQMLDELLRQVHRRGAAGKLLASRRNEFALILIPADAPPLLRPARLAERVAEQLPRTAFSWGIPKGSFELLDLADAMRRARRVLEVGRALHGPGNVADADGLEPFLILGGLAEDPEARRMAEGLLRPLLRCGSTTARELVHTLEVYLEENGNTSSAARRLFLNRHSLMYRLRKIESLTRRDLSSHDDRFALEMSLRLYRLHTSGGRWGSDQAE